jgi:RecB family exonuclease
MYHLDGVRAKSVTAVAKIAADSFAIDQWEKRQVAIGLATDANLIENVAANLDNRDNLNKICDAAKTAARAHAAADRGTQMHRVLQLVLLDQEHKLITPQQRADAELLKRTLDRYRLRVYDGMAEQFVIWPEYRVTGRFDAILEQPSGRLVLTDLKSGPNAVEYPHATSVQLALYARAPLISDAIRVDGDRLEVTDWREMPTRLDYQTAYVLLAEPGADVGEFYEMDITHGWAAGAKALEIVNWRKRYDNGYRSSPRWGFVRPLAPPATVLEQVAEAPTLEALRQLWVDLDAAGELADDVRAAALARSKQF